MNLKFRVQERREFMRGEPRVELTFKRVVENDNPGFEDEDGTYGPYKSYEVDERAGDMTLVLTSEEAAPFKLWEMYSFDGDGKPFVPEKDSAVL